MIELATGLQVFLRPAFSLALQLRGTFPVVKNFRAGSELSAALGVRASLNRLLYFRGLVGAGLSSICLQGDVCGTIGPTVTAELGAELTDSIVRPLVLARVHAHFAGMNGVGPILAPTLGFGVAW